MLVMCFGMAIGTLVYALGWLIVETIRKRKTECQPDCTVTETGVGIVEPWQITQEREAWDELLNAFDFGDRQSTTNYHDFSIGDGYMAIVASHWTDRMTNETEYYIKPQS